MAVVACQKQSVEPMYSIEETDHGTYIFTINVGTASLPDVKTDYDSEGHFSWSAGDAISVLFHNGDDNKFFTLTTTGTGSVANFSGEITSGYEIGASDGTVSDKKIWALYPASANHTYTEGNTYPTFYVQPEVDFTTTHFSANIPMYDVLTDLGTISFKYLASAFKFTITDLDASVNKVKVIVTNQKTHGLSGSFPVAIDGSTIFLDYGWTGEGTPGRSLTFTANKSGSSAVFYVPCRYYGNFHPEITIYNAENNNVLKHLVAANNKVPAYLDRIQPITISAPGTGDATPTIDVDWSLVTTAYAGINDRIVEWKTTSDTDYIYFYYKFTKAKFKVAGSSKFYIGFDKDNDPSTGSTSSNGDATTGGIEAMAYFYPWTGGSADGAPDGVIDGEDPASYVQAPVGTTSPGAKVLLKGTIEGSYVYIEAGIPRTALGITVGSSVTVITAVQNYKTTAETVTY